MPYKPDFQFGPLIGYDGHGIAIRDVPDDAFFGADGLFGLNGERE